MFCWVAAASCLWKPAAELYFFEVVAGVSVAEGLPILVCDLWKHAHVLQCLSLSEYVCNVCCADLLPPSIPLG